MQPLHTLPAASASEVRPALYKSIIIIIIIIENLTIP